MKRCHYDILGVERKATPNEIKIAYRKMAMKYHPDKNQEQDAKKVFLQLQQAYDVLSDPNERTFYDNNREKILFNKDDMSKEDLEHYSFGFNIFQFFTARCYKGFTDDEGDFFQVYRGVFELIKAEEIKAYQMREDLEQTIRKFEGFGVSTTNIKQVLTFYNDWENFTSYKSFVWSEQYDTRQGENRWQKRRMAEENKKERLKEKKNYIKTIKDLVNFVKKRDFRFQQFVIQQRADEQRKQQEKLQKIQDKKRQKQEMKLNKQKLQAKRFQQIEQYHKQQNALYNKGRKNQDEQSEQQQVQYYCEICEKTFKAERQLWNHENSKTHKQNVKMIEKQVMLASDYQNLAQKLQGQNGQSPKKKKRFRKKKNQANGKAEEQAEQNANDQEQSQNGKPQSSQASSMQNITQSQNGSQSNTSQNKTQAELQAEKLGRKKAKQLYYKNQKILKEQQQQQRRKQQQQRKKNEPSSEEEIVQVQDANKTQAQKKIGKAKKKKLKKAEQLKNAQFTCKTCQTTFSSRTKLFEHIKFTEHAATKQ